MKQAILLLFIALPFSSLYAQGDSEHFSINHSFEIGEKVHLYGNMVNLREEPNTQSNSLDILPLGFEVEIIEKTTDSLEYNGFMSSWYKVKYKDRIGYVLGGLFSLTKLQSAKAGGTNFYFNLKHKEGNYYLEVRANRSNGTIQETSCRMLSTEFSFLLNLTDNRGLEDIDNIITVDYVAEACGYDGGMSYFFWSKNGIKHVADLSQISEAGIFYFDEVFIFPNEENGVPGKVVYEKEQGNTDNEEYNWHTTTKVHQEYTWDGYHLYPEFMNRE